MHFYSHKNSLPLIKVKARPIKLQTDQNDLLKATTKVSEVVFTEIKNCNRYRECHIQRTHIALQHS
jgi:hypothetical protein